MGSVKLDNERLKAEISARFKQAREALKLSPPQLAAAIGSAAQTIRDYEDAKSIPGGAALAGLSRMGIDVDFVLTGEGEVLVGQVKRWQGVEEPQAPYGAAFEVNPILLQGVLDFFFGWLDENADRVRIDRDRYGAMISVLYRIAAQSGAVRKAELAQVLAIAA